MQYDFDMPRELLCQALPHCLITFFHRPDNALLCRFCSESGIHLFDRVISREEMDNRQLFDELIGRIQRDLILNDGPLPPEQQQAFTKRIPLPTFEPGRGKHRQRKIVIAGNRLRRLAGIDNEQDSCQ